MTHFSLFFWLVLCQLYETQSHLEKWTLNRENASPGLPVMKNHSPRYRFFTCAEYKQVEYIHE